MRLTTYRDVLLRSGTEDYHGDEGEEPGYGADGDGVVFIVPQGLLFVWPTVRVGFQTQKTLTTTRGLGLSTRHVVTVTTLSVRPKVFALRNFATPEEVDELLTRNAHRVKRSTVGLHKQKKVEDVRTSHTTFDHGSPISVKIQTRMFDVLGEPYRREIADGMQVVRYQKGDWYKPHCDWFDTRSLGRYNDPRVNNGTNRFATVFMYLQPARNGGHTVFPLSTSHAGWNGERVVDKRSWSNPGFIDMDDARWACNVTSASLKVAPGKGDAVLFYNQEPDGTLDGSSLHGGCPPLDEDDVKWGGNLWVWNRPYGVAMRKAGEDQRKGKAPVEQPRVVFHHKSSGASAMGPVHVFWVNEEEGDAPHFVELLQAVIRPGGDTAFSSYEGHRFKVRLASDTGGGRVGLKEGTRYEPWDQGNVVADHRVGKAGTDVPIYIGGKSATHKPTNTL